METYFEPPRLHNKRAWEVMRILAVNGFTFHSEGSKAFVEAFILGKNRPNPKEVQSRIAEYQRRSTPDNGIHPTAKSSRFIHETQCLIL